MIYHLFVHLIYWWTPASSAPSSVCWWYYCAAHWRPSACLLSKTTHTRAHRYTHPHMLNSDLLIEVHTYSLFGFLKRVCACGYPLLQLINFTIDIFDVSIQGFNSISAVIQCAVVVLDGPLESWENDFISYNTIVMATLCVCVCVILTAASARDLLSLYSCVHTMELAFRLLNWSDTKEKFSPILSRSSNREMTQLSHTENKHTDHERNVFYSACVLSESLTFTVHTIVLLHRNAVFVCAGLTLFSWHAVNTATFSCSRVAVASSTITAYGRTEYHFHAYHQHNWSQW